MATTSASLTREQVREVDRRAIEEYGMLGLVLMENAGRGAADLLVSQHVRGPICVCCGKGNNGGDGFVIARHLEAAGLNVRVVLAGDLEDVSGDAAVNLSILRKSGMSITRFESSTPDATRLLRDAEWIVDALLGTGISGEVRAPYASVIEEINESAAAVLAVDLPSGLDCDRGVPLGTCVRADRTATFVARKAGFDLPGSLEWTGLVNVLTIGVPRCISP